MKKTFLIVSVFMFVTFLSSSCKKESPYMTEAIITGSDARMCICCGGLMITFNGETRQYTGDFKLVTNGTDLGITDNDRFPIYLKVDWKTDTTTVCNRIIITRSTRR